MALLYPKTTWFLLEASVKRAAFLRYAVSQLGLEEHVTVEEGRAEELARRADLRHGFDVVVARAFGPPAVTAECAASFLRVGGCLVVSEPPTPSPSRWPARELAIVGLRPQRAEEFDGSHFQVLEQVAPCGDRYPRRVGVPAKRPLF